MRGFPRLAIFLAVFGTFLGVFPAKMPAQCPGGLMGVDGVSLLSGNPFQAEIKHTSLLHTSVLVRSILPSPVTVARDTEGRLRLDRNIGKFKVQDSSGGETEEERHSITICDPVKGESLFLDTMNKTATIQKLVRLAPRQASDGSHLPTFCARELRLAANFPGSQTEDLGHRTIEGFDAEGVLRKRQMPSGFTSSTTSQPKESTSETETWCSDELGAVLLRNMGTVEKGMTASIAMINIQRGEPDATLFQIPTGYRMVERVNVPGARTGVGVVGGVSVVAPPEQIILPDKP
jgi:hypothetical protein